MRANTGPCQCRADVCRSLGRCNRTADAACCYLGKRMTGRRSARPARTASGRTLIDQTVRSHGGRASVHYRRDGLTCEIELPLPEQARAELGRAAATPKLSPGPSSRGAAAQGGLQGKRILVIEDEPLVSMQLEADLAAAGCEVIGPAATLDRAKALVEEGRYDAALLDVNLKGQPVDELAALLTEKNRPFAFVTGYGRDALPEAFRGAAVLAKPFSSDQLLATAQGLLRPSSGVVQLRHKRR